MLCDPCNLFVWFKQHNKSLRQTDSKTTAIADVVEGLLA